MFIVARFASVWRRGHARARRSVAVLVGIALIGAALPGQAQVSPGSTQIHGTLLIDGPATLRSWSLGNADFGAPYRNSVATKSPGAAEFLATATAAHGRDAVFTVLTEWEHSGGVLLRKTSRTSRRVVSEHWLPDLRYAWGLSISPDGRFIYVLGDDGNNTTQLVVLRDGATPLEVTRVAVPAIGAWVAIDRNELIGRAQGDHLYYATRNAVVQVATGWVAAGEEPSPHLHAVYALPFTGGPYPVVAAIALAPSGQNIYVVGYHGSTSTCYPLCRSSTNRVLIDLDAEKLGQRSYTIIDRSIDKGVPGAAAVSPDGSVLYVLLNNDFHAYDTRNPAQPSRRLAYARDADTAYTPTLLLDRDGRRAFVQEQYGSFGVIDLQQFTIAHRHHAPAFGPTFAMAMSPYDEPTSLLASAYNNGTSAWWSWKLGTTLTSNGPQASFQMRAGAPAPHMVPLMCDWNGDGVKTPGFYDRRTGMWTISDQMPPVAVRTFQYGGESQDQPVCGDWDGNGTQTVGVKRGSVWWLNSKNGPSNWTDVKLVTFGEADDIALVGDWTGSGVEAVGVLRRNGANWKWMVADATQPNGMRMFDWNPLSCDRADFVCKPVVGDWFGTGRARVGAVAEYVGTPIGTAYNIPRWLLHATLTGDTSADKVVRFGSNGAVPVSWK